jgi:SAM-dependent methyltransferase
MPLVEAWHAGASCCDPRWEDAYRRFESPQTEVRKFRKRLIRLGARDWPRDARILDLFCGRGNGLAALASLGFTNLSGVDLSEDLLRSCTGDARLYLGDCRDLHLPDGSVEIAIVQGGLHHLPELPADLERTLYEVRRVLTPGGRFVTVEPWDTPFLRLVHRCCASAASRRVWRKLDALATMIEQERTTYDAWLTRGEENLVVLQRFFRPELMSTRWGKLSFVGRPNVG